VDLPTPPAALAALATFVRGRLAEVEKTLSPLWSGRVDNRSVERAAPDGVRSTARHVAMVIVGAAAPFAPNSYARTRLVRQMHAAGLLSDTEARRAQQVLDVED
jgi:hypothetical protein